MENTKTLREKGYFLNGHILNVPTGQINLEGIRGAQVVNTDVALVWKFLGLLIILNVAYLIVMNTGPGAIAGFLLFLYGLNWFGSRTDEVRALTQNGELTVATITTSPCRALFPGDHVCAQELASLIRPPVS